MRKEEGMVAHHDWPNHRLWKGRRRSSGSGCRIAGWRKGFLTHHGLVEVYRKLCNCRCGLRRQHRSLLCYCCCCRRWWLHRGCCWSCIGYTIRASVKISRQSLDLRRVFGIVCGERFRLWYPAFSWKKERFVVSCKREGGTDRSSCWLLHACIVSLKGIMIVGGSSSSSTCRTARSGLLLLLLVKSSHEILFHFLHVIYWLLYYGMMLLLLLLRVLWLSCERELVRGRLPRQ